MKRFLATLLLSLFIITNIASIAYGEELEFSATSVVLMDADSQYVLLSKNAHEPIDPASTTMVLTALTALDHVKLDEMVTITDQALELGVGSNLNFSEGERLSAEQLIAAMLLQSDGTAAIALALHAGQSLGGFSQMMNDKAKELGMVESKFINPSGLHDEGHYSTATDMALLMNGAMDSSVLSPMMSLTSYTVPPTNLFSEPRNLTNGNKLFNSTDSINVDGKDVKIAYPGLVGSKAGYNEVANNCIISMADRKDLKLIVTVFGSEGVQCYADTHKLFDFGYTHFKMVTIVKADEFIDNFSISGAAEDMIPAVVGETFTIPVLDGQTFEVEKTMREKNVDFPLKKGEPLAELDIRVNGNKVGTVPIVTTIDVHEKTDFRLWPLLKKIFKYILLVVVLFFIFVVIMRRRRARIRAQRLRAKRRRQARQHYPPRHRH